MYLTNLIVNACYKKYGVPLHIFFSKIGPEVQSTFRRVHFVTTYITFLCWQVNILSVAHLPRSCKMYCVTVKKPYIDLYRALKDSLSLYYIIAISRLQSIFKMIINLTLSFSYIVYKPAVLTYMANYFFPLLMTSCRNYRVKVNIKSKFGEFLFPRTTI